MICRGEDLWNWVMCYVILSCSSVQSKLGIGVGVLLYPLTSMDAKSVLGLIVVVGQLISLRSCKVVDMRKIIVSNSRVSY